MEPKMRLNPDRPEETPEELPPIPPGQVRPLTDPEAVRRWFAMHEPPRVLTDWNPFSRERMKG
jgi:hypothetical protein